MVREELLIVVKARLVQRTVYSCELSLMTGERERLWASEVYSTVCFETITWT